MHTYAVKHTVAANVPNRSRPGYISAMLRTGNFGDKEPTEDEALRMDVENDTGKPLRAFQTALYKRNYQFAAELLRVRPHSTRRCLHQHIA